jgi:inhibitor of cysteine peptidase
MSAARISAFLALGAIAVALSPVACAATTDEAPVSSPTDEGDAQDEIKSLAVTEADNGKTVTITKGQNLLLKLQSNPSTGYKWAVSSTDKTFGYPTETFVQNNDGAVGSGGVQRFTWKSSSMLNVVGSHTVKLEYKRSGEKTASKTFTFTVKVADVSCPQLSPPAPGFCSKGRIEVKHNADGCVTGYECVADCRTNGCSTGSRCSVCWATFACVPNGAMC